MSGPEPMSVRCFAERLRKAREATGLAPKALAARAGIPWNSYKDYEAGKTVAGGVALAALLRAGIDINWILGVGNHPLHSTPPADVAALAAYGAAMLRQQASTRAAAEARAAIPQSIVDRLAGSGQ